MRANWVWSVGALIAVAALSFALYLYLQPESLPDGVIYGNGRVEATEVRIGSEVAGRVVESNVVEGRAVAKGDLLVRIDDADLKLQLAEARANRQALVDARKKAIALARVGQHHTMIAKLNTRRYRALSSEKMVSRQQEEAVENSLSEAQGLLSVGEASAAQTDAQIAGADEVIARIEERIAKCRIVAPNDGTILTKMVEPGEVIAVGQPLAVLADLRRLEIKIYVPEYELGRLKLGSPARVETDAFPGRFLHAVVERIDQHAQFTPREIHMPDERVRTVFGVTLAVTNPGRVLKPGMPADAWVKWRDDLVWPNQLVVPE